MDNHLLEDYNGIEDEEEALRIAIALSIGQQPDKQIIDLTEDDECGTATTDSGNFQAEISTSRPTNLQSASPIPAPRKAQSPASAATASQAPSRSIFETLGLDRKKMEEERLARIQKRKAVELCDDCAHQESEREAVRRKTEQKDKGHLANPDSQFTATATSSTAAKISHADAETAVPEPSRDLRLLAAQHRALGLQFPYGTVKRTWVFGQQRTGDDIRIEEVLLKDRLLLAVVSSFQWDEDWLLRRIDISRTKLVLVAFAADERQKEEIRNNVPRDRIRFCFPPMGPMGSMHSKLMLLKFEKFLRIVVPTGNFMSYDWGETGTMENMVFIIDLPKFETREHRDAQQLTPFAEELFYFLRAQKMDDRLVDSLLNYDFSETRRYGFVCTIPGTHNFEDDWKRIGYCGLGRAVGTLGLATHEDVQIDIVAASIGNLTYSFLSALHLACKGDSGLEEYNRRYRLSNHGETQEALTALTRTNMKVYFPSRETVIKSTGGPDGAGTICFQEKWWQDRFFPRELFHDCKSVREGLLMHSKLIYVRDRNKPLSPTSVRWAYVGSANLSESAWGRLIKDRTTGRPKMMCRNWECGVIIPGSARDDEQSSNWIPIPLQWPSRPFRTGPNASDADTPWFSC